SSRGLRRARFVRPRVLERIEVGVHAGADVLERLAVADRAQLRQVRLRVALVMLSEPLRERDVADPPAPESLDQRTRELVERGARARPHVEDAAHARMVEEPEVHADDVLDVDEVAALLARLVAAAALEEPRLALLENLPAQVMRDARHRALVGFARSVDVEVAQADDLRIRARDRKSVV